METYFLTDSVTLSKHLDYNSSLHEINLLTWPHSFIHSFNILSDDRSKASSKTMPPYSAMQSLLLQMRISSPVLKVIQ